MSERPKSSKSRAVQSLKSYNKPGNKEDMSSRTWSKKSSGTSKSPDKYCSNSGEVHSRRASTSDKHRARSRSRSPLLRTSSDGRCDSRISLADHALRARVGDRSSSRSRDESVHRPSGLGRASPSGIRAESRPVKATFHVTISICEQRATGKIQRNNYHCGSCRPSLTGKTSSVSLIVAHGMHQNVKNR